MNGESRLTVFFEDPFWIGVYERMEGGRLEAARMVFGPEPRDYEVYEFLQENLARLQFSSPVEADGTRFRKPNPKRMQRQINRQLDQKGAGTRAQQALKLQHEQVKKDRQENSRRQYCEEIEKKRESRRQKQKARHKGH